LLSFEPYNFSRALANNRWSLVEFLMIRKAFCLIQAPNSLANRLRISAQVDDERMHNDTARVDGIEQAIPSRTDDKASQWLLGTLVPFRDAPEDC
jgi:hypothetical protein